MADVSIRKVVKRYGKTEVIHGLDLEIPHNEFLVMVGPSGCGKSTMLRMIAGLEDISAGEIWIDGRMVNNVEPKNRNIAMVFQNYALYPHMSVRRNIGFGLRAARLPKAEVEQRVLTAAKTLGLDDLLERKPAELSGGQRQRVSMGRAIVRDPSVFLFDEPLSNLDAKLRNQMRTEIKKLHRQVETTIVYVTHDQVEAMTLADRIVVLRDGHIQQIGTPLELFHEPANLFVAGFIGSPAMNFIDGHLESLSTSPAVRLGQDLVLPIVRPLGAKARDGMNVVVGIRPDDLELAPNGPAGPSAYRMQAPINVVEPMGTETMVFLEFAAIEVIGKARGRNLPALGMAEFEINLEHLHFFDAAIGDAL
ncbi:MAG: sn-glycerol-3-phosphate ABC transporter ATP-binding protein UgpC [Alphaproteobacteria bacterium]|nr:sn-glycerol-3-phosphate ABC transporter ATP-binding protein UgpC [Alphaproteobacteria bacterium]